MSEQVVAITVTARQRAMLEAVIREIKDFGCGWRILDEIAIAVYDALPVSDE